jgi:L-glutamine-phosphate cytidylyltransferase
MKAIILAAGRGTRLDGAALKPKCLLEVGGQTLLQRQMESIRLAGIRRIVVVVGFGADQIRRTCDSAVSFVENAAFADTGSLYSLWLARGHLHDGFVVINSDVLFHPDLLANLLASPADDALLLSDADPAQLGDEEMKVRVRNGLVVDISKELDPREADGENVGIVKFGARGARALTEYLDDLVVTGAATDWAPRAFREFALHHPLHALSTNGLPWTEIDFPGDYQRAVSEVYPRIEAQLQGARRVP